MNGGQWPQVGRGKRSGLNQRVEAGRKVRAIQDEYSLVLINRPFE